MRSLLSEADASLLPLSSTDETRELLGRIGRLVRESRRAADTDEEREREEREREMRNRADEMPETDASDGQKPNRQGTDQQRLNAVDEMLDEAFEWADSDKQVS
jgi:Sec-independent protein translocase protein TatA